MNIPSMRALITSILLISALLATTAYARTKYVGNEACIQCHKKEGLSWSKRSHAKAFESLKAGKRKVAKKRAGLDPDKDYTTDKLCLRCHTTGYRKPGGYKSAEKTPKMKGVGCEACHGAGSKYRKLHDDKPNFTKDEAKAAGELYADNDPVMCKNCHIHKDQIFTEKIDKKYKYDYIEAIKNRKGLHDKFKKKYSFGF